MIRLRTSIGLFSRVDLQQLLLRAHGAELLHGLGAQLGHRLCSRHLEQLRTIAGAHERAEDVALHGDVVGALEDVEQRLLAVGAAKRAEMLHGASPADPDCRRARCPMTIWRASGDAVLREHIQRALLEARRSGAVARSSRASEWRAVRRRARGCSAPSTAALRRERFPGLTGWPARWRISTSSARASVIQRLSGYVFRILASHSSAAAPLPCLFCAHAIQYIAPSARVPF